jgi:flagellar protein FlaG
VVTVLLIITGVVCTLAVFNAVYPAIGSASGAMVSIAGNINDRIKSKMEIVQVSCEDSDITLWAKNVGSTRIGSIEDGDVFFGQEGNFARIPYDQDGSPKPCWNYSIENDSEWGPTATLKITIYLAQAPSGAHFVKVVAPNGVLDEYQFSN